MSAMLEITLKKSWITSTPNQRENLKGLGLWRREHSVLLPDTATTRGMIRKVIHLVGVRRAEAKVAPRPVESWVEIIPPSEPVAEPEKKARKATKRERTVAAKAAKASAAAPKPATEPPVKTAKPGKKEK